MARSVDARGPRGAARLCKAHFVGLPDGHRPARVRRARGFRRVDFAFKRAIVARNLIEILVFAALWNRVGNSRFGRFIGFGFSNILPQRFARRGSKRLRLAPTSAACSKTEDRKPAEGSGVG